MDTNELIARNVRVIVTGIVAIALCVGGCDTALRHALLAERQAAFDAGYEENVLPGSTVTRWRLAEPTDD